MIEIKENTCWHAMCKWKTQGKDCVHCSHPNAIQYCILTEPCPVCKRKPEQVNGPGCGNCIGRGGYVYPTIYEDCDSGGYEISEMGAKILNDQVVEEVKIAEKLNSYP